MANPNFKTASEGRIFVRHDFLNSLYCPSCRSCDLKIHSFRSKVGAVESGLILCRSCGVWYPVVDSIPVVSITPVIVEKWKQALRSQWAHAFNFSDLKETACSAKNDKASSAQQEQIEFYDHEASRYDSEITNTVFWRSFSKQTIHKWGTGTHARAGMILEIGCGTGASTAALAGLGCRIVALDICLTAAKVARDKIRKLQLADAVDFIVSEAESLPFRPELFQSCIFSGVLHHVSSPALVLKQISRVLASGGVLYGHENNASAFRFLFDLLMKMKRLWHEEAGTHPLMDSEDVKEWGKQAGLDIRAESMVFLPPHFFNLFSQPSAERLLLFTNRILGMIPWVKDQGGLLIISGTKTSSE